MTEINKSLCESSIGLQLPDQFDNYDANTQANIVEYLIQLDTIEKKAYKIAKEHLGSSFNVVKSNGFCDWIKSKR